jgi:hypothetical protein
MEKTYYITPALSKLSQVVDVPLSKAVVDPGVNLVFGFQSRGPLHFKVVDPGPTTFSDSGPGSTTSVQEAALYNFQPGKTFFFKMSINR